MDGADAPSRPGRKSPSIRGKVLSDMTLSKPVEDQDIAAVPHGFRSSYRRHAAEPDEPPARGHRGGAGRRGGNQTEAAYARSDVFERRRRFMSDWAAYLDGERSRVIPIRR